MPKKKPRAAKKSPAPQRTPKRKTAIPAIAPSRRRASKPVEMRLVIAPSDPVEPTHEMTARRAFEIWENYSRLAADTLGHWLQAEKQLCDELNGSGT
jgi:hypothetical protein